MHTYTITGQPLTISEISNVLLHNPSLNIDSDTRDRIASCRSYLEDRLASSDKAIYGINTGFGSLCDVKISQDQLDQLQLNLVRSHACGMGDRVPEDIARCIFLLKIINMSLGHSGVRTDLVERMIDLYNQGIAPTMYQLGSLGASGDLAPLAHLAMTIIGEDPQHPGIASFALKEKEGIALLNGTQFSLGYSMYNLIRLKKLFTLSNRIATMSLDAFKSDRSPFTACIHTIRPHAGQVKVAQDIWSMWEGSEILDQEKVSVQDPYSFRCIPQVHGATYDAILHAEHIFTTELNSVTDNPLIFPDEDMVLSGGNFHAQPLAMVIDYLAMAASELANISERRTYQLINGDRGLPYFLVDDPGINSGFMIPQYTAASIINQNKQLAVPTSTDSIVSCKGQEDHVSMAANGATKLHRIVDNVARILSIELLVASQALDYRRPARSSETVEKLHTRLRSKIARYEEDRFMQKDLEIAENLVHELIQEIPY